jgi:hypothetical protein
MARVKELSHVVLCVPLSAITTTNRLTGPLRRLLRCVSIFACMWLVMRNLSMLNQLWDDCDLGRRTAQYSSGGHRSPSQNRTIQARVRLDSAAQHCALTIIDNLLALDPLNREGMRGKSLQGLNWLLVAAF